MGALESAKLNACFLHQRVCVPLDAAVTPVTVDTVRCVRYTTYRGSGEPGGFGRGECVRSAINNRTPRRRPRTRHRRAQRARQHNRQVNPLKTNR